MAAKAAAPHSTCGPSHDPAEYRHTNTQKESIEMKTSHDIETLKSALAALEDLNAIDLVGEFRAFEHDCHPGTYCALVLDPSDGTTNTVNEASWSCSTDEYFNESGELSRTTLISSTRAHWSPSPDDGFEWGDGDDYIWDGSDGNSWILTDSPEQLAEAAEEVLRGKLGDEMAAAILPEAFEREGNALTFLVAAGWEEFGISSTPVDGWVSQGEDDHEVQEVEKQLQELRDAIQARIEELEAEEETAQNAG